MTLEERLLDLCEGVVTTQTPVCELVERAADDIRLAVCAEAREHGSLEAYEAQVRMRAAKKGPGL